MLKSLDIVNRNIEEAQEALDEATDDFRIYPCEYGTWEEIEEHYTAPYLRHYIEENKQIKQDLAVLEIFTRYISLSYIKNLISENEFSLNNFDWDIKDEKRLTNRIEELLKLKQWLESDKVGADHD